MAHVPTAEDFYGDILMKESMVAGKLNSAPQPVEAPPATPRRPPQMIPVDVSPKATTTGLSTGLSSATGSSLLVNMLSNNALKKRIGNF
jgi:hypothetical protein